MRTVAVLSLSLALTLLLAGGAVLLGGENDTEGGLTRFSSENELRSYLKNHVPTGYSEGLSAGAFGSTAQAPEYSPTNLQVEGVEEGDIVKTNGSLILVVEGMVVHVIGTTPSLHNITDIEVARPSSGYAYVQSIYLSESRLVVILSEWAQAGSGAAEPPSGEDLALYPATQAERAWALVYALTDPANPSLLYSCSISGYITTSRMVGTTLYLVADQPVPPYDDLTLPEVTDGNGTSSVDATDISYDPSCPEISYFINLLSVDTATGASEHVSVLASPTSVAYMSATSLYLTMTHYSVGLTTLWGGGQETTTAIYRIGVNGTAMSLEAEGEVPGWPLNQFALDERDGFLRIATTDSWSEPSSNVFVLDSGLRAVGELKGIAPGERIFSTRFFDDRLYMVTFRQVDPLFVIDLSSTTPSVVGELKVPGVSTYLQMVDQGLLGIGTENGTVKVSLFNVSDPSDLKEVASYMVEEHSTSVAQYDHKAVLYDQRHGFLVIPVNVFDQGEPWISTPSCEALVLDLEGVSLHGWVAVDGLVMIRSLYVGDVLYIVSDRTVEALSLHGLEVLDRLEYSEGMGTEAVPVAEA